MREICKQEVANLIRVLPKMMENAEETVKTEEDGEALTVMLMLLKDVGGYGYHNNPNGNVCDL